MLAEMEKLAQELRVRGKTPYVITGGGSDEVGTLGYVACVREVLQQMSEKGLNFSHMVTTVGSCGTYTGLVAGMQENNSPITVIGISVHRSKEEIKERVCRISGKLEEKWGMSVKIDEDTLQIYEEYVGEGYSILTEGAREAVQLVARTEGILLDPVYTGKTMAGLIDLIRKGYFKKEDQVLFLHTGGTPALYVYTDQLTH